MWTITGRETALHIAVGWFLNQCVVTAVVIWAADLFWQNVDVPSARLTRWLEFRYNGVKGQ